MQTSRRRTRPLMLPNNGSGRRSRIDYQSNFGHPRYHNRSSLPQSYRPIVASERTAFSIFSPPSLPTGSSLFPPGYHFPDLENDESKNFILCSPSGAFVRRRQEQQQQDEMSTATTTMSIVRSQQRIDPTAKDGYSEINEFDMEVESINAYVANNHRSSASAFDLSRKGFSPSSSGADTFPSSRTCTNFLVTSPNDPTSTSARASDLSSNEMNRSRSSSVLPFRQSLHHDKYYCCPPWERVAAEGGRKVLLPPSSPLIDEMLAVPLPSLFGQETTCDVSSGDNGNCSFSNKQFLKLLPLKQEVEDNCLNSSDIPSSTNITSLSFDRNDEEREEDIKQSTLPMPAFKKRRVSVDMDENDPVPREETQENQVNTPFLDGTQTPSNMNLVMNGVYNFQEDCDCKNVNSGRAATTDHRVADIPILQHAPRSVLLDKTLEGDKMCIDNNLRNTHGSWNASYNHVATDIPPSSTSGLRGKVTTKTGANSFVRYQHHHQSIRREENDSVVAMENSMKTSFVAASTATPTRRKIEVHSSASRYHTPTKKNRMNYASASSSQDGNDNEMNTIHKNVILESFIMGPPPMRRRKETFHFF